MGFFSAKKRQPAERRSRPAPAKAQAGKDAKQTHLAFVLLSEATLPDPHKVSAACANNGHILQLTESEKGDESDSVLSFSAQGSIFFVALMPMPIPDGEAEDHVSHSLSSFTDGWTLPPYHAHLMVTMIGSTGTPVEALVTFTDFLAAITTFTPSVGVYWGNAGATHQRDFFLGAATAEELAPRMMIWSGISVAQLEDGRLSILSLGMGQLGLPDVLFTPTTMAPNTAIMTIYDLLVYFMNIGKPIPNGDTIGRSADERIVVRYVRSPRDNKTKVLHINGM